MDEETLSVALSSAGAIVAQLVLLGWAYRHGRRDEAIRQRYLRAIDHAQRRRGAAQPRDSAAAE